MRDMILLGLGWALALLSHPLLAQDTFSIVAVDVATGQVGSAGATCLDDDDIATGALIISDVIPDVGAIHTQSYWVPANQNAAHDQVADNGLSPEELMDWLEANDVQGNPAIRQYGMADLVSGEPAPLPLPGRTAWTGGATSWGRTTPSRATSSWVRKS